MALTTVLDFSTEWFSNQNMRSCCSAPFPDVFGKVVANNGNGTFEVYRPLVDIMLATEYPGGPPYNFWPGGGWISSSLFSVAAALNPNLSNLPWPVDFVVDGSGDINEQVWQQLISQSTPRWATDFAQMGRNLEVFFDCDLLGGYNGACVYLDGVLNGLSVAHTYQTYSGTPFADRFAVYATFFLPLNATVEINPDTLNVSSCGRWVTTYLELPAGLAVDDIDLSTVAITEVNGMVLTTPIVREGPTTISDVNGNGISDVMVKFDRREVIEQLESSGAERGDTVDITVDGQLLSGWYLEAVDTVQVCGMPPQSFPRLVLR